MDESGLVWLRIAIVAGAAIALFLVWFVLMKGRRREGDLVFRASRLSHGNRLFPAQVVVTPETITHFHPQFIGRVEESIHIAHVSSIRIDTNLLFADIYIETTGGEKPIVCYGHTKGDAIRMKQAIEQFQSKYYGGTRH
jgi:hypothetical protein